MPAAGPIAARTTGRRLFVAVVLLVAAARLLWLTADPPPSMPDPTLMDEGLWADSARGRLLFAEGWFADDLGNAYLIAPLYTYLLTAIYWLFGIGLWQTRLLAALCSLGTALLAGRIVAGRHGERAAATTTALVGLCPLLDQYGRFAMLESPQGFALLVSFALLFPLRPTAVKAALAGAAMGAAMLIKPNAATFGVLPFACAFALEWRADVRSGRPGAMAARARQALAAILGGGVAIGAIGAPVWLAHWPEWLATVDHESGSANWRLADHLWRLGLAFAREDQPGRLRLSAWLRHAPLLSLGLWLLLLRRAGGTPLPDFARTRPLWVWLLVATVVHETSYDHVARRQVLFLPVVAILVASAHAARKAPAAAVLPWSRAATWLLLVAPAAMLVKPWLANALAPLLQSMAPAHRGGAGHVGGWVVLLLAAAVPAIAVALRIDPAPWRRRVAALAPLLLAAAAVWEGTCLSALPPHEHTVRRAQDLLAARVEPGSIAVGEHASLLLQGTAVRTVRRVLPGAAYSSPRPNPDVCDRIPPRYVIDYVDPGLRAFADITAAGFAPVLEVGLLQETSGTSRFPLQLWQRR